MKNLKSKMRVIKVPLTLLLFSMTLTASETGQPARILMSQELASPDGRHAILMRRNRANRSVCVYSYSPNASVLRETQDLRALKDVPSPITRELVSWSNDGKHVAWASSSRSTGHLWSAVATASIHAGQLQSLAVRPAPIVAFDSPVCWLGSDLIVARVEEDGFSWLLRDDATGEYTTLDCNFPDDMEIDSFSPLSSRPGRHPGSAIVKAIVVLSKGGDRHAKTCFTTLFEFSMGEDRKAITARPIVMLCTLVPIDRQPTPRGYPFLRQRPEQGRLLAWSAAGKDIFVAMELWREDGPRPVEVWRITDSGDNARSELLHRFVYRFPEKNERVYMCPFSPMLALVSNERGKGSVLSIFRMGKDENFRKVYVDAGKGSRIRNLVFVSSEVVLVDIRGELFELDLRTSPAVPTPIAWP